MMRKTPHLSTLYGLYSLPWSDDETLLKPDALDDMDLQVTTSEYIDKAKSVLLDTTDVRPHIF